MLLVISKHHFLRKENNGKDSTVNTVKTIAKPASDLYLRRVCFGGFDLYILYLVKNLFRDSSVFVIELAVVLVYLPRDAAGIAVSHDIRRNIFRNDAARADNAVVPYRHAGHYQSPRAYPAVSADMHGHIELIRLFAQLGQNRMPRGRDGDIRAYHRVRADVDMRVVHGGEIEISVYTVAQMHMRPAPVRVERRFEIAVLAFFRQTSLSSAPAVSSAQSGA